MAKITAKPGKPRLQQASIACNLTESQYFIIEQKVAESGLRMSEYLRQAAINGKVVARWEPEDKELFKKLVGISNDINRLVNLAREQNVLKAVLYFEEYRNVIDEVIKKFSHVQ